MANALPANKKRKRKSEKGSFWFFVAYIHGFEFQNCWHREQEQRAEAEQKHQVAIEEEGRKSAEIAKEESLKRADRARERASEAREKERERKEEEQVSLNNLAKKYVAHLARNSGSDPFCTRRKNARESWLKWKWKKNVRRMRRHGRERKRCHLICFSPKKKN